MKDIIKRIKIHSTYGVKKELEWMNKDWKCDPWTVRLTFKRRQMTIPFFKGIGHGGAEPGKKEVLACLISDARAGEMDFEEFCAEFGYDTDSRRAEKIWKECRKTARKLRKFLGEHFDEVVDAVAILRG